MLHPLFLAALAFNASVSDPEPPPGYKFLVAQDGAYLRAQDGAYYVVPA